MFTVMMRMMRRRIMIVTTMMLIMMMVKFMQSALSEFDNCHHHYCQAGAHDIIGQDDICHGDASRRAPKS